MIDQIPTDNNNNKIFRSRDLYLSAYLSFKGAHLISAKRENGRVFFCFENKAEILESLREFTGGNSDIPQFLKRVYDFKTLMSTVT